MKKMKKFFAMFLALAMVLGMSVTTFAADTSTSLGDGVQPASGQKGTVTISGGAIKADKGITFEVYKLIKADFDPGVGFSGYSWVFPYGSGKIEIADPEKVNGLTNIVGLTGDAVNNWAASATGGEKPSVTWSGNAATMELEAGTYMIIAKSETDKNLVFSPMLASVYYQQKDSNNAIIGGTVDAGGNWSLVSTNAYQKSTDLTNKDDKKVGTSATVDGKVVFTEAEANAQVGESRAFQLTGLIPSYGPEYFAEVGGVTRTVTYTLKDSRNEGLKYNNDIVVYVGGNPITSSDSTYKIKWYSDNTFTTEVADAATAKAFKIEFASSYVEGLAGVADNARSVEVIYSAEITSAAVAVAGQNQYTVDYTRQPGEDTSTNTKTVYTYTAAINGAIKKVDEAGTPLANATFALTYTDDDGVTQTLTGVPTAVEKDGDEFKASSGNIKFEGLKFGREYTLKETKAPDGYSINSTEYKVVCNYPAGFDDKGTTPLTKYTVTVTNKTTNAVTTIEVPYGGSADVLNGAATFVNTTLTSLPSTGGIGTTIFTVGGCAIMIIAAGLYFSLRRRTVK